jgi:hypothetical protein
MQRGHSRGRSRSCRRPIAGQFTEVDAFPLEQSPVVNHHPAAAHLGDGVVIGYALERLVRADRRPRSSA